MSKTKVPDIHFTSNGVEVNINTSVFGERVEKAQFWLDSQVMTDMVPLMPMQKGTFIQLTRARSASMAGTGQVCAAAGVYGRYLYEGKVMVDSVTGKGPKKIPTGPGEYVLRFRKGAKLVPTERPLTYSNPQAVPHWFDVAKANHEKEWVDGVRNILGGDG